MESPQRASEPWLETQTQLKINRGVGREHVWRAAIVLGIAVAACSIYANLSFMVADKEHYKYFPPFRPLLDHNNNRHLGAEYFYIAKAIVAGRGFANPFGENTGPTAWMPPALPCVSAGLLCIGEGSRDFVMVVVIALQVCVLLGSGIMVGSIARGTSGLGTWAPVVVFLISVLNDFYLWFQFTHDTWLVLLAIDVLLAGLYFCKPLQGYKAAAVWGLCGGIFAMINPVLAFAWAMVSLAVAARRGNLRRLAVTALVAAALMAPWTVRNYLIFGRFVPVKSNLAFELYQSQCLEADGLLQAKVVAMHPYNSAGRERQEYVALGEMAFLDHKRELFWQAVAADPLDFVDRVLDRFVGATVWYTPLDRSEEAKRPWVFSWARLTHPLPFLALVLMVTVPGIRSRLCRFQWAVIGVYVFYLLPYVIISYYDRYAAPLLGVKVLMILWAAGFLLDLSRRRGKPPPTLWQNR